MYQKRWLFLGYGIEVFHIIFAVAVLIFGGLWVPYQILVPVAMISVASQVITLGCPLSLLSNYFLLKYDPNFRPRTSLTFVLYQRYGRAVAIPIIVFLLALSIFVAWGIGMLYGYFS